MCGREKHHNKRAKCTCICPEHSNFQAAYDLAMRRYDQIKEAEAERGLWYDRAGDALAALRNAEAERDHLRAGIEELADEWEAAQAYNRAHMGQLTRDTPRPDDLRQLLADTHDVRDDLQREFGGGL